jgi:alcohol dehydrogenase class IV
MCLGPVNTAAVHALSYPLGVTYHIPHGVSIALLLPYVMEFNLEAAPERYADIAQALGAEAGKTDLETAREGVRLIRQLIADCQLPSTLEELGIPSSAIESLAKDAMNVRRLLKNNLRVVTEKDARAIYQAACKG